MFPPLWLIVKMMFFGSFSELFHLLNTVGWVNAICSALVSSDHSTFSRASLESGRYLLANVRNACTHVPSWVRWPCNYKFLHGAPGLGQLKVILCVFHFCIMAPIVVILSPSLLLMVFISHSTHVQDYNFFPDIVWQLLLKLVQILECKKFIPKTALIYSGWVFEDQIFISLKILHYTFYNFYIMWVFYAFWLIICL